MAEQSLDGLVKDAIANAIQSDSIKAKVQAAADKAIADAIESAFGYSSEFRKGIKTAVEQVIPLARVDDVATFTHAVKQVMQQRLANLASDTAEKHLGEVFDRLLPADPIIGIGELRTAFVDKVQSDDVSECHCEEEGEPEIAWHVEHNPRMNGYWDLWMSPDPDSSRYSKDSISLRFRRRDDGLHECWAASVGERGRLVDSLFGGPIFGFDAMVFRLATGVANLKGNGTGEQA